MIHVSSKVIELHRTKGYIQLTHVKWKIEMYMYFTNTAENCLTENLEIQLFKMYVILFFILLKQAQEMYLI